MISQSPKEPILTNAHVCPYSIYNHSPHAENKTRSGRILENHGANSTNAHRTNLCELHSHDNGQPGPQFSNILKWPAPLDN